MDNRRKNTLYAVIEFKKKTTNSLDRFDVELWDKIYIYETKEEIAEDYGINAGCIFSVINGQSWGRMNNNKMNLFVRYHDVFMIRANKFHIYTKKLRDAIIKVRPKWSEYCLR